MGHLTLVLGGIRSGKSAFAEQLAADAGERVLYLATAEATDAEMQARIQQHRHRRPSYWTTIEEPLDPAAALEAAGLGWDAVLVDSVSMWLANLMGASKGCDPSPAADHPAGARIARLVDRLIGWAQTSPAKMILVSDEVGLTLVADNSTGRRFQDLIGGINQQIATGATDVFFVAAGLPLQLKHQEIDRVRLPRGSEHDPDRG